jgi:hypothetical protein
MLKFSAYITNIAVIHLFLLEMEWLGYVKV